MWTKSCFVRARGLAVPLWLGALLAVAGPSDGALFDGARPKVGDNPRSVAVADLDGDGFADVVTANFASNDVSVLLGNGDGTFQVAASTAVGPSPRWVAVSDLDGDTIPDLVTTNVLGGVNVLLGNGDGTFKAPAFFAGGDDPNFVVIADLDGDSIPDLVTANPTVGTVSVLLGNGDGTFQGAAPFSAGESPRSVAVGDLNGDSVPDLVAGNGEMFAGGVSVLLGNGDGTFQAASFLALFLGAPGSVAIADLDGDSMLDLIATNFFRGDDFSFGTSGVSTWLGNGDGSFQASVDVFGSNATFIVATDLDEDTLVDLVSVGPYSHGPAPWLGNGDGTFQQVGFFEAGFDPRSVAVADFNGDTIPDLVVANAGTDDVSVLSGFGDGTFEIFVPLDVGHVVVAIAAADLDGDAVPDMIVSGGFPAPVLSVLLGVGDGTFQVPLSFAVADLGNAPPVVADLNGDSMPDIVVLQSDGADQGSVLLGNGDGSFQAPYSFAAGNGPDSLAAADLDGDGVPDLVTGSLDSEVNVMIGNGDGTFHAPVSFATFGDATSVAMADFNGDAMPDIVSISGNPFSNASLSVLLGNGDGTFQAAVHYPTGDRGWHVAVADLNDDSAPDVVVADAGGISLSVLLGNGDGTFQAAEQLIVRKSPQSVGIADFDGDTIPDLVTANISSNDVSVLLGNGDGTFQEPKSFVVGSSPRWLAVADLDGDSFPDVMTTSSYPSDGVSVLLNRSGMASERTVVTFDGTPPLGQLTGEYDGIDWGTSGWLTWSGVGGACAGPRAIATDSFSGFAFTEPSVLESIDVSTNTEGGFAWFVSLDDLGLPLETSFNFVGSSGCRKLVTGWSLPAASVVILNHWSGVLAIDNFTYTRQ